MSSKEQKLRPFEGRGAFAVSLALSFVIIFGVACVIVYQGYMKAIDAAIRTNETRATLLAKLILEHQRAAIGVLESYADRPLLVDSVKRRDFEGALNQLIDLVKRNPEMDWPFLSNPDSTVWVNHPVDRQVLNKDLSHRDWYKGVSKEWKPYISSVYKLIVGENNLAVAVSVPIFDEKGKVIGILATAQSTAFFRKVIGEVGLNAEAKITLVDQEGHIVYSNGLPYTKEVTSYPSLESVKRVLRGDKGNAKIRDASDGGGTKYVSVAPIEGIGWSVIVEEPGSAILRLAVPQFALIGVIALLLYGVVALSLVRLKERHRQMNEMRKLNDELDGRVKERTTELETRNIALRESEERYRLAIQASNDAIWDLNLTAGTVHWNETYATSFGRPPETGNSWQWWIDHIHPEDRDRTAAGLRSAIDGKADAWTCEYRFLRADGAWADIYDRSYIARDESGRAWRVVGAMLDITDRKRTEAELRQAVEIFEKIFQGNAAAMVLSRMEDGCVLEVNDRWQELTGFRRDEVIGKKTAEIGLWKNPEDRAAIVREVQQHGSAVVRECVCLRRGGQEWTALFYAQTITLRGERMLISSALDMTERRRAEQALRQSEDRLRGIMNNTGDPIFLKDLESRMLVGNPAVFALIGKPEEEVLGKNDAEFYPDPAIGYAIMENDRRIMESGQAEVIEELAQTPWGYRTYLSTKSPWRDEHGRVIGLIGVSRDITERKRAEDALRQKTLELQHLTETLEDRVKERTAELANLSSQLVSAQENERKRISYDLHDNVWQTLDLVKVQIEHLFSRQGGADWAAFQQKAKQLIPVIENTVARIRSVQGDLWPYVLDDIGILATLEWYCREFGANHPLIRIEKHVDLAEAEVPGSARIVIYRVMQEALINIAKHSRATHVSLSLIKGDHHLEFIVRDGGIGFDLGEARAEGRPWGGMGILSMKQRTELSGGIFTIHSEIGKGTTIKVSWPVNRRTG